MTDPAIVGTFNYYTYDLNNSSDPDKTKHGVDIATWVLWGSGINDKTLIHKKNVIKIRHIITIRVT